MEAASTSETSVNTYQTTWHCNLEDTHLHLLPQFSSNNFGTSNEDSTDTVNTNTSTVNKSDATLNKLTVEATESDDHVQYFISWSSGSSGHIKDTVVCACITIGSLWELKNEYGE
jgi:hypothetical protein